MEKSKTPLWKRILVFWIMFVLSGGIALAGSLLYGNNTEETIRNTVMVLTGTGVVIFAFSMSEMNGLFIYRNEGKYSRFTMMYLGSLIASVLLPYLPVKGWPFLVLFVLLGVFSNGVTGVVAGSTCLLVAVNLSGFM